MKHWQETQAIVRRAAQALAAGREVAVATVVRIEGSAYRRPGAKLLIDPAGDALGGVSGGCLEADVREVALTVIREHAAALRHYDTGSDENTVWGLGLGCNGKVDVFMQPVTHGDRKVWSRVGELLEESEPFVLATVVSGTDRGRAVVITGGAVAAGSTAEGGAHPKSMPGGNAFSCEGNRLIGHDARSDRKGGGRGRFS